MIVKDQPLHFCERVEAFSADDVEKYGLDAPTRNLPGQLSQFGSTTKLNWHIP